MSTAAAVLAARCDPGDPGYCPPGLDDFIFAPLWQWQIGGVSFEINKVNLLLWFGCLVIIGFFVVATRNPKLIPGPLQWTAEEMYGFVRNGIAREVIGPKGVQFAPYFMSLFAFIFMMNLYEILPVAQMPVTSKFAFPFFLTVITYVLYIFVGVKQKGPAYFKQMLVPSGVPLPLLFLITPIELFSNFIVRPFTLAVRLFANMFAGHLLLLVFFTGTTYLLTVENFSAIFSVPAFFMSVILTFFEFLIVALQAYIFTILTAVYVSDAYVAEH